MSKVKTILVFTTLLFLFFFSSSTYANEFEEIQGREFEIFFDRQTRSLASETAHLYPILKKSLEQTFGWSLDIKPSIVLIQNRESFLRIAESPLTIAFAVPSKSLIVIDCSSVMTHPLSLELTLKHEMCHLLLHRNIKEAVLPRWLDEGTCQWVSDGAVDILIDQKRSTLNRAALSKRLMPFGMLENKFPRSRDSLVLAYEQSKSFVNHIASRFGKNGLLAILENLSKGDNIQPAVSNALSVSLTTLETEWQAALSDKINWFALISYHIYEILFGLMALVMILASVRLILKKKAYMNMHSDE
ncbi:peptidase MA family metallohydrolase [Thermodesulfobacteriota bacterium]